MTKGRQLRLEKSRPLPLAEPALEWIVVEDRLSRFRLVTEDSPDFEQVRRQKRHQCPQHIECLASGFLRTYQCNCSPGRKETPASRLIAQRAVREMRTALVGAAGDQFLEDRKFS